MRIEVNLSVEKSFFRVFLKETHKVIPETVATVGDRMVRREDDGVLEVIVEALVGSVACSS